MILNMFFIVELDIKYPENARQINFCRFCPESWKVDVFYFTYFLKRGMTCGQTRERKSNSDWTDKKEYFLKEKSF